MRKSILALFLVLVVCFNVFVLAGCKGGGTTNSSTDFTVPEGGYDGTAVTVTFWHTMNQKMQVHLDEAIKEFREIYPNINVVHAQKGGYEELRSAIATVVNSERTEQAPSLAYCYADHVAQYNLTNSVISLDNLIADSNVGFTQEEINDFVPAYYNEGKQFGDGKMYTLPLVKSTEVLYYNETFFTKNNIPVPKTWDEMEQVMKKIKELKPNSTPLGYDAEDNWFITLTEQYGTKYTSPEEGNHFLFNNKENQALVERLRTWRQAGYVTTKQIYGGGSASGKYTSGAFTKEECYMVIGSSGGAGNQVPTNATFNVGIAPIPQATATAFEDKTAKAISQGPSLCLFNKENEQEVVAAWLFAKFLSTNPTFLLEVTMLQGYVPALKSIQNSELFADWLSTANGREGIAALAAQVCIDTSDIQFTSPAFYGSSVAREQVGQMMVNCMITTDPKEVAGYFQDALDACLYAIE